MKKRLIGLLCGFALASCGGAPSATSAENSSAPAETTTITEATTAEASTPSGASSQGQASSSSAADSSKEASMASSEAGSSSSKERVKLPSIDYVKLYSPAEFNYVYIWKDGVFPCGNWPGRQMSHYDEEWVIYDLSDNKQLTSFNVIFHDNKGHQSPDLSVSEGAGHYFFLNGDVEKRDYLPNGEEDPLPYDLPDNEGAYRNFYQLLVYSFADSNGDGIGDFKGIKDKLGYLKGLGIESIWLSPINKSSSYHAYDVLDYYAVNELYEANGYTLNNLIEDAHGMGIEIVLDLVLNHTANNHPWLREHPSWYGDDNKFGMPEFDFDNPEVRAEMKSIGRYWLNKGVDGFRLDAAMWVYNSGSGRHKKNYEWWNEWCSAMREAKSGVYIIAEVLDSNHDLAYEYAKGGFNSTFDFEAMKHVHNAVKDSGYDYASLTIEDQQKAYGINPNYCLGRPLSNHDVGRFSDPHNDMGDAKAYYCTSFEELRLANSLNILTPGNTFLYYGDELGMKGSCPQGWDDMNYRTPMPFASEMTDSVRYFNGFKGNGVTSSGTLSGKTAEEDSQSESSLYAQMKALLNLKIAHPTIKSGKMEKLDSSLPSGLNGYAIKGSESIAVIYNSSSSPISHSFSGNNLYDTGHVGGNSVNIPSKGVLVYSY